MATMTEAELQSVMQYSRPYEPGYSSVHEDLLRWVMNCYGFLIPRNVELDGAQFAHLIEQTYYCGSEGDGPINNSAAETVLRTRGTFYRTHTEFVYIGANVPRLS